ncbi:MAG: hypothetical protein Q4B28_02565 [bacterium]|nr:hypothetical protein [bacterium]
MDNQLKLIMDELLQNGGDPIEILKAKGFDAPALDTQELQAIVAQVIQDNPQILAQYRAGKMGVL